MTVSRNALATADFANASSVATATNNNLTALAGSNVAVFALLSLGASGTAPTAFAATCNSVAMTLVGSFWDGTDLGGAIFAKAIGTLGSSAVQNVTAIWTNAHTPYLMTIAYNGVDQTTPGQNFTNSARITSASASLGITSAVGDMAVLVGQANIVTWSSWTFGTDIKNDTSGNQNMFMGDIAGASTATITAALSGSGVWAVVGCDIKAAAAGGPALPVGDWTMLVKDYERDDRSELYLPKRKLWLPGKSFPEASVRA